ncbi:hypothetical protein AVEN_25900-1 [Araneus ventricosus]|uniref:Uncharacterized protein n=1 Tax=Araneus ventricosus TaxID=182803 RepID=A0A4Y2F9W5_ARAVE|nr:hypothetical protein AVEN_25900-1 [Araneus ventricosus]
MHKCEGCERNKKIREYEMRPCGMYGLWYRRGSRKTFPSRKSRDSVRSRAPEFPAERQTKRGKCSLRLMQDTGDVVAWIGSAGADRMKGDGVVT